MSGGTLVLYRCSGCGATWNFRNPRGSTGPETVNAECHSEQCRSRMVSLWKRAA